MSPDPLVRCRSLGKTYLTPSGGIEALRSVDADFQRGQITAVVGPSGSGKSTLLRALAGLDHPTTGHLLVDGRDLARSTPAELRRHRRTAVAYVSQKPADNFVPHLTLAEHAHDAAGEAQGLLASVGLAHRLDSLPIELSGGEQARGAFALALARSTPLIVIDEPTAELDQGSSAPLLDTIRRHAGAGAGFVIATHDPAVTAIADTVLHLDRGHVVATAHSPAPSAAPAPRRDGSAEPVLRASSLGKAYRTRSQVVHAVREASIDLRRGDLGVVLGRSGSGKSTLLTLLARWQQPDTGTIHYPADSAATEQPDWEQLGYLPQRFGLLPELSVRENVELPARLGHRRAEFTSRLEQLLGELGLDELADRRPPETSIGQQQRTALARALLLQPTLLIADEPTSHQDAGWRDRTWQQLVRAAGEGTTCVVATHEERAAHYGTRVWQISEGILTPAHPAQW